jgi:hypothetical protein
MPLSQLLAFAAMLGIVVSAHGAVSCFRADGTQAFVWACEVGADDQLASAGASDGYGAHGDFTSIAHDQAALRTTDGDCFDIPVQIIARLNVNSRRESLWIGSVDCFQLLAYLDAHRKKNTTKQLTTSHDDRRLISRRTELLRTVVLLI